jgi:hypothetical protein
MPLYGPLMNAADVNDWNSYQGDLLTVGQETFPRRLATNSGVPIGASGNLRGTYFTSRKSETVTQVRMWSGGTAAAATPTLVRAGLWTVDASGNGTALIASIANDTTLFAATNTAYTRSFSVSVALTAGTRYAFGVLVVSGAAVPTLNGTTNSIAAEMLVAPPVAFSVSSLADLPSTFTATAVAAQPYAVLLP